MIEIGDTLTVAGEIIDNAGCITFNKGQRVIVTQVIKRPAFVGKMSFQSYPEQITGVKVEGHNHTIWFPDTFEEFKK